MPGWRVFWVPTKTFVGARQMSVLTSWDDLHSPPGSRTPGHVHLRRPQLHQPLPGPGLRPGRGGAVAVARTSRPGSVTRAAQRTGRPSHADNSARTTLWAGSTRPARSGAATPSRCEMRSGPSTIQPWSEACCRSHSATSAAYTLALLTRTPLSTPATTHTGPRRRPAADTSLRPAPCAGGRVVSPV